MVNGDPFEEEPMTAAPHLAALDGFEHLLGRDDLTVDDVAGLPEDLNYELVHGRLVVSPSALLIHQTIIFLINAALRSNCPRDRVIGHDQSVMLDPHTERRPDVVAVRKTGARRSPIAVADVFLAVEVLSPSSRMIDGEDKMKDYAYAGIPSYWIVDAMADRVTFSEFHLGSDRAYRHVRTTDQPVTVDLPWAVALDPPQWTSERDSIYE